MYKETAGNKLIGTDYSSKHNRLSLLLEPSDSRPEYKASFVNVVAYSNFTHLLGKIIIEVIKEPPKELFENDWERVIRADMAGIWPGPPPQDINEATKVVTEIGLNGYRVNVENGEYGWAVSRDYVLLGRRARA